MATLDSIALLVLLVPPMCGALGAAAPVGLESAGLRVTSIGDNTPATISLAPIGRFQVKIQVDPAVENEPIELQVETAATGPLTWPAEDLGVVDGHGRVVPIRRNGIEWHRFDMIVPGVRDSYRVSAVAPEAAQRSVRLPTEAERTASDPATGVSASVCRWYGGHKAALSVRFDDSHPTHLSAAVPILREHGLRVTFMINPGRSEFQAHRAEWEALARSAEHEFANHTMNHRGAATEAEIEREVGQASEYIWRLFPQRSRLVALNRGGGTVWVTRGRFRRYLEKYHLFNVSGSLGMDDVYGRRVAALQRHLSNAVARGGWAKVHYHAIGAGLSTSEEHFQAAMQLLSEHADQIWITGLADAFKYQQERRATKIVLTPVAADRVVLAISCGTDPQLYDHPLTIEFHVPPSWSAARLSAAGGGADPEPLPAGQDDPRRTLIRYHVRPVSRRYVLSPNP